MSKVGGWETSRLVFSAKGRLRATPGCLENLIPGTLGVRASPEPPPVYSRQQEILTARSDSLDQLTETPRSVQPRETVLFQFQAAHASILEEAEV